MSLQETVEGLEGDNISSGYDCTQRLHPPALSFISVRVCINVCIFAIAVALPPEKTDSCCVEEKMQERDIQSTAGPQKQLQFEVSVSTEWYFSLFPLLDETGAKPCHIQTHTHEHAV